MDRSLWGHTIVAGIMVALAYVAWTSPKATATNKVKVIGGAADQLEKIQWHEAQWDVSVERKGEDTQVAVQRFRPSPPVRPPRALPPTEAAAPDAASAPEGDTPPPTAANASPPDPPKVFPGTDRAKELFEKLAPLEAARSLGVMPPERLEALGLKDPEQSLTLFFGEQGQSIQVGKSTYGSGDLYVRRTDSGEVFLLPSSVLGQIRHGANSLIDKRAIGAGREKIERLNVSAGARGREIVQRNPEDKENRFFADPADPDVKLELTSNWLERVLNLRAMDLTSETPRGAPAIELEIFAGAKTPEVVRLWRSDDKWSLATSTRFSQPFTVAKAAAEAILKDVDPMLTEGR